MRVVSAEPARKSSRLERSARERHTAHLEGLGLASVAVVILFGVWLSYSQHKPTFDEAEAGLASGTIANANLAGDALPKTLLLTPFATEAERQFAARAISQWRREGRELTHVGALAGVSVAASDVARDPRLTTLNERARRNATSNRIPLLTANDIAAIKPSVIVRSPQEYASSIRRATLLLVGVFLLAHLVRRNSGKVGEPTLLPTMMLLIGIAVISMMSLRDPLRDTLAAVSVVYGAALGCVVLTALAFVDFETPRWRRSTLVPFGVAVGLAGALVLFGSGPGTSGAKVNLLGVQPIEVIRLLAIFALASYFSRRWELLREVSTPIGPIAAIRRRIRIPRARDVQPLAIIVGTLLVFFVLQKDLGPALVLGSMALALYGVARAGIGVVFAGFMLLLAGFAGGYWLGIPSTVARRIAIWMDPWHNGLAGGDQIAHAQWALASGGFWGIGTGIGDGHLVPAGHTDLIVAVIGEELGFVGLLALAALYALLIWRILRVAARAPGDFTAFLALGCALSLFVPCFVIVGGLLGLLPLSGVVTPFLSYGKSSMICNIIAVAIPLAIAKRSGMVRPAFGPQLRTVAMVAGLLMTVIIGRAAWLQVFQADDVALRPSLVRQADGGIRYQYNPRLLIAAGRIPRGTIFDRNGIALATSNPALAASAQQHLVASRSGGFACAPEDARCYPLGPYAFHVIGDATKQTNWAARNTSFVERDSGPVLQGFDDHPRTTEVTVMDGTVATVVTRDYRELLPLVRNKGNPTHPDVRTVMGRNRDVRVTIDAPLQAAVARALEARARAAGSGRAAAVVVDVQTGAVLASASYPWPEMGLAARQGMPDQLLDRARYGLYPPGSTFKLVTAVAALKTTPADLLPTFECVRLADGRVGAEVRGLGRPLRDDSHDRTPHGRVDLRRGLVVSCNAFFGRLAMHIGAPALADAAGAIGVSAARSPVLSNLARTLPFAAFGQGEVVASPLRMASAVAAIAGDGSVRDGSLIQGSHSSPTPWLSGRDAAVIRGAMREAVVSGTGRLLAKHPVAIAGKTGTAEVQNQASHSWFVGFAPSNTRATRIAFAIVVENAGYGGRAAAAVAGDIVTAARSAEVIR